MQFSGKASPLLGLLAKNQILPAASSQANFTKASPQTLDNDFGASLAVRLATLQAQSVGLLLGSPTSVDAALDCDWLSSPTIDPVSFAQTGTPVSGLSATGRNLSLFDPESAYQMMTEINAREVSYKAQSAELGQLSNGVVSLQQSAQKLVSTVDETTDSVVVQAQLQSFIATYNDWISRFQDTVEPGGVLDGTQAAELSLYEFEQSIENRFNGAAFGLHGLKDLGLTIDPTTHRASLDTIRLDSVLTSARHGVIETIDAFSESFAQTAMLLNSKQGLIANRLNNLDHAIDYIADNKTSLQSEFGLGDPATPSPAIMQAIASYNRMYTLGGTAYNQGASTENETGTRRC